MVLADFDNKTGEPVFDDALKQALAMKLEQSPFLERSPRTARSARPADDGPSCDRTHQSGCGSGIVPAHGQQGPACGTISNLGSHYLLELNAVACSSGDTLVKEQARQPAKKMFSRP